MAKKAGRAGRAGRKTDGYWEGSKGFALFFISLSVFGDLHNHGVSSGRRRRLRSSARTGVGSERC